MSGKIAITVYGSEHCSYCLAARMLLKKKGLEYEDILVTKSDQARQDMERITGRHTVPQIIINGTVIGGFDELYAMDASGELDAILAAANED
jgi:glutaredoxin 3